MADTLRMLDNWEHDAVEKAAKFQDMADRVAEVAITESVADGAVSATVGNNGLPTDIAMTDRVREMSPDEIAANVMAAIRKAQSRYPQRLAEIMAETVGDDPAGAHIVAEAERNFPPPPEDDEEPSARLGEVETDDEAPQPTPPPPRRTRPSTPDDEDDDFGDEALLDR
ncbi:YbaB/EbfC DNA-binding family protein [Actinophytocola oryzae]|uniref:YbaB/EbfC DNA-binding family protein n=2 Tax=Actinophytocola oryzae TaxID=502181 RepID=A0A4R7VHZ7_9PSEU|nr:YbaB/EbfC DNA-binding family protein [Actinophytocola oryzae]